MPDPEAATIPTSAYPSRVISFGCAENLVSGSVLGKLCSPFDEYVRKESWGVPQDHTMYHLVAK